jgi:Transposase DDE domain
MSRCPACWRCSRRCRTHAGGSKKRIRTLLQDLDAAALDVITGSWLRTLAVAGKLDGLLTAIAIDGKWLRGVADGQVKLFAAMLHDDGVIIAQHRTPDDTNEITQVRELLDPVGLSGAVVTADAAHAQHDTHAAPPRTTSASSTGTAASCAAPSGSPTPTASISRMPPR